MTLLRRLVSLDVTLATEPHETVAYWGFTELDIDNCRATRIRPSLFWVVVSLKTGPGGPPFHFSARRLQPKKGSDFRNSQRNHKWKERCVGTITKRPCFRCPRFDPKKLGSSFPWGFSACCPYTPSWGRSRPRKGKLQERGSPPKGSNKYRISARTNNTKKHTT